MSNINHITWHQLATECPAERVGRLNKELHRIFFDSKEVCPESFAEADEDGFATCQLCRRWGVNGYPIEHSTPHFLESLDAMQLIVESGKFAEVEEVFFDWLEAGKKKHECTIFPYINTKTTDNIYFRERGHSRQEAFYLTALKAMGYTVVASQDLTTNAVISRKSCEQIDFGLS